MRNNIVYCGLLGLVIAGMVHIIIILLIPSYAAKDAWATLQNTGKPWEFSVVSRAGEPDKSLLRMSDPRFSIAACRFKLSESPLSVLAEGIIPFWSVAVFDRLGKNVYSFNDRTAIEQRLDLLVVNPVQMAKLKENPSAETQKTVLVEADIDEGFVLIRTLAVDDSWRPAIDAFLNNAVCSKFEIEEADGTSGNSGS